jgi:glyoxalase family protein
MVTQGEKRQSVRFSLCIYRVIGGKMEKKIGGIHHVTAIASDPQRNVDFYAGTLGLRMAKVTVNFDDPGTYHFYYGDEEGRPGTILTFFPWPGAQRGRRGSGQATAVAFSVPQGSLDFWAQRLEAAGVKVEGVQERLGEKVLTAYDPDGLVVELVADAKAEARPGWPEGPVPVEYGVRGVHGVTLSESDPMATALLMENVLGFEAVAEEDNRVRFQVGEGGAGTYVDILHEPGRAPGLVLAGTIHHVAYRTPNGEEQESWRELLYRVGAHPTNIRDRQYFQSIYFRAPGGVLFEIATDTPGMLIDEKLEELGSDLQLPPQYEGLRAELERSLPEIEIPGVGRIPKVRVR